MISLSATTFDLDGHIEFNEQPDSRYGELVRRASRNKTLNAGVSVSDFGFTHADRDFEIRLRPTVAEDAAIRYLVASYAQLQVSTPEGVFTAIPRYNVYEGLATIGLEITEKIA